MRMKRYCPVCLQFAIPTRHCNVWTHRDSIGRDICPMSGKPYDLTIIGSRRPAA